MSWRHSLAFRITISEVVEIASSSVPSTTSILSWFEAGSRLNPDWQRNPGSF
jgi:hypothetical protein